MSADRPTTSPALVVATCASDAFRIMRSFSVASCQAALEVKADLRRQRPRRDVMRAAERREKVVQRVLVAEVDRGETSAPLVAIAVEQIVVADGEVEQIARATRGGLWSSFSVPGRGICSFVDPYIDAGQIESGLIGVVGVA